jgi:hypothetical protein
MTKGAGVSDHNPREIARRVLEPRDRVFAIPLGVGRGTERYEAQQEYELACIAYADDLAQALTEALAEVDALRAAVTQLPEPIAICRGVRSCPYCGVLDRGHAPLCPWIILTAAAATKEGDHVNHER